MHIDNELETLNKKVKELRSIVLENNCAAALRDSKLFTDALSDRWADYIEQSNFGPRNVTLQAMLAISKGLAPAKQPADAFDPWVKKVLAEPGAGPDVKNLRNVLKNLHDRLVNSGGAGPASVSVINGCAVYYMASFRDRTSTFSFDDRQYFTGIQNLLRYFQIWQARGLQMLQEALLFRAQQAAMKAWAANQAVRSSFVRFVFF